MNLLEKPSAIIFDFDDTLVNSKPIIKKSLQATFDKFKINQQVLQTKDIDINRSLRDYFYEIFKHNLAEAREAYYSYYDEYSKDIKMLDHAEDVLKFLLQNQVYTVVVSNKNNFRLRDEIHNKLNWKHYFAAIVGSGDVTEDKPSSMPAKFALQNLELNEYKDVWLIGDSIVDLRTAENLGCKGILFKTELNEKSSDVAVHHTVNDHLELLDLLKGIYV